MIRLLCFYCCCFLLFSCAGPGQQIYETGQKLQQQEKYTEAIKFYTSALKQEPENKEYRKALQQVEQAAAKELLNQARSAFESPHLTHQQLQGISHQLGRAVDYDSNLKAASQLETQVDQRIRQTEEDIRQRYQQAKELMNQEQYYEVAQQLLAINQVFKNYEDVDVLLLQAKTTGSKFYLTQGAQHYKENDYPQALKCFDKVPYLNPSNAQARRFLELSQQRNKPEFFIQQSQQLLQKQQIDQAHQIIEQGITLFGLHPALLEQQTVVSERLAQQYLRQVEFHYHAQSPFSAMQAFRS